jgi:tRNA 2-selenouridine synthase
MGRTLTESLSGSQAPPGAQRGRGSDGHAREKDAGSANSSAIRATEDAVSRRPVLPGGRGLVFRQAPDLAVPSVSAAEVMEGGFQVVDVRSPSEFADGHMPGAVNRPLLDDAQRETVGIAYRSEGAARARMAAMEVVSPNLSVYLTSLAELARSQPRGRRLAIMCWRGGERSRNVVLLLALIGVHAVAVAGGYRAFRREVVARLAAWHAEVPVLTLYGPTGSGKSALLRALVEVPPISGGLRPWPVDLEDLALHRGSLLGGLNQPGERRQKDFDALLWEELRDPQGDYLVLEGEGGKIGRIFVAASVAEAIRTGIPVLVSASVERRSERIMAEYAPDTWDLNDVARFRRGLSLIAPRLPQETVLSLESAFDDGRFTDVVKRLLVDYYDPLYQKSCVDGRQFALEFETGPDPVQDARRFARGAARLIREAASSDRGGHR